MKAEKTINNVKIEVIYDWEESCNHVYKTFEVYLNDKKSNIQGLRKFLTSKDTPQILTVNTYHWRPASSAWKRRSNEKNRVEEIKQFFLNEGFKVDGIEDIRAIRLQKLKAILDD